MHLLWRVWRRICLDDRLGAAAWLLRKQGIAYVAEMTFSQRRGMRALKVNGLVELEAESLIHLDAINASSEVLGIGGIKTSASFPRKVEAHWHVRPGCHNAVYEFGEAEALRLGRSIDRYRLDAIDDFIARIDREQKKCKWRLKPHIR